MEATHISVAPGSSIAHRHQSRPGCVKTMDPDMVHCGSTDPDLTRALGGSISLLTKGAGCFLEHLLAIRVSFFHFCLQFYKPSVTVCLLS